MKYLTQRHEESDMEIIVVTADGVMWTWVYV